IFYVLCGGLAVGDELFPQLQRSASLRGAADGGVFGSGLHERDAGPGGELADECGGGGGYCVAGAGWIGGGGAGGLGRRGRCFDSALWRFGPGTGGTSVWQRCDFVRQ